MMRVTIRTSVAPTEVNGEITGAEITACGTNACGKYTSFSIDRKDEEISCHDRHLAIVVGSGDSKNVAYLANEHDCLQEKQETTDACPMVKRSKLSLIKAKHFFFENSLLCV